MANVTTIPGTCNWAAASILNRPTQNVAGNYQEPALTNANWLMSTILGPPFAWQWNRSTASFTTTANQSDYVVNLPNFGWLEKVTISNTNLNPPVKEIAIVTSLTATGTTGVPWQICPVFDNNAGQITFRLLSTPDTIYTVTLTYQLAPNFVTSLYGSLSPLTSVANASLGLTTYTGTITGGAGNGLEGQYLQVTGFTASATVNNGLYLCTQSSGTTIQLQNPNGVAVTQNATVAPGTTWAPIPDKYNFLYETGMLARLYTIYDRSAYLTEMQLFWRQLVGCSEGLSDSAKSIFLEDKLAQLRTEAAAQYATSGSPKKGQ